jgi:hypothetical protein
MLENDHAKRAQVFATLTDADVDFLPETPLYQAPRDHLRFDGETLIVEATSPAVRVPWAEVRAVSFREPLHIDDQALVLTEGESPAGFLWAPLVAALLLALAAFNAWYLLRPRRAS